MWSYPIINLSEFHDPVMFMYKLVLRKAFVFPEFSCGKINKEFFAKMKFSMKDFFSKCDHIHSFQRIWLHLLKKSLIENYFFFAIEKNLISR